MRHALAVTLGIQISLVFATGVTAATPPTGLAGTMAVTARTATTATIHAEQTGGAPVTLRIEHNCRQGRVGSPITVVKFLGSTDATFNIGPSRIKGRDFIPEACWAWLTYQMPSQTQLVLAGVNTLGCEIPDVPCA